MDTSKFTPNVIMAIILIILLSTTLVAITIYNLTIPSEGEIVSDGLLVFKDEALTERMTKIEWRTIVVNCTYIKILYITNIAGVNGTLHMHAANFNPSEQYQHVNISWDREGYVLQANQTVTATITMIAYRVYDNSTIINFSYNTVLTLEET